MLKLMPMEVGKLPLLFQEGPVATTGAVMIARRMFLALRRSGLLIPSSRTALRSQPK